MELERVLPSDRGQTSTNIALFTSVGGSLAKNLGLSEYNSPEINISRAPGDLTQNISRIKQEFLPFLHERDGLNRLISVPSKFDPSKLEEPSNPIFYYKAERFNKVRLRLGQADRNQQALGKMLHYSTEKNGQVNVLETNKNARMQKLNDKKTFYSTKQSNWLIAETEADLPEDLQTRKKSLRIDTFGDENPQRRAVTEASSPTQLKPLSGIRPMHSKAKSGTASGPRTIRKPIGAPVNPKTKSEPYLNKPFFKHTDDFCGFYKKLDNDKKRIETSASHLKIKAQDDVDYLNHIAKQYNKISQLNKKKNPTRTLSSFAMPSFKIEDDDDDYEPIIQPSQENISQIGSKKTSAKNTQELFFPTHIKPGTSFLKKRFAN